MSFYLWFVGCVSEPGATGTDPLPEFSSPISSKRLLVFATHRDIPVVSLMNPPMSMPNAPGKPGVDISL